MEPDVLFMVRRGQFFSKLLGQPSYGTRERLLRDAGDLNIPCDRRYHRVIVAEIELWEEFLARGAGEYDPEARSEANFILSNICVDLFHISDDICISHSDFAGRLVFWLDSDTDAAATEQFRAAAEKAAGVMESEYRLFVTFSISEWFEDLLQTFFVYNNTLNLLYCCRYLSDQRSACTMLDLPAHSQPATLSRRSVWEHQLISMISSGDMNGLREQLQDSLQKRFFEEKVALADFPQRRCSFQELLELTVWELGERYGLPAEQTDAVICRLDAAETALGQLAEADALISRIEQQLTDQSGPAPAWIRSLASFIEKNYTDSSLTLYSLAEQVHLTSSYCARLFRQYMGISILDYLKNFRVQRALELLNAGHTMADVAGQCGFTCTQTLRRTLRSWQHAEFIKIQPF